MGKKKDVKKEPDETEVLKQACAEYESGWKRALADYENLKRDMAVQTAESRNRIKANFAQDLLPVMDNFDQAVVHAPDLPDHKAWLDGVLYIKKQFEDVLAGMGLERIDTTGPFDPHLHEAVSQGEAFKEVSSGWKIGDHVVRPAKVVMEASDEMTNEELLQEMTDE